MKKIVIEFSDEALRRVTMQQLINGISAEGLRVSLARNQNDKSVAAAFIVETHNEQN